MRFSSQAKSFPLGDSITVNCRIRRSCAKSDDAVYDDAVDMICSLLQQSPSMPVSEQQQQQHFSSNDSLSLSSLGQVMAGTASTATNSTSSSPSHVSSTFLNDISLTEACGYGVTPDRDVDELSSNSSTGSNGNNDDNSNAHQQQQEESPSQLPPNSSSGPALLFQPLPKPPSRTTTTGMTVPPSPRPPRRRLSSSSASRQSQLQQQRFAQSISPTDRVNRYYSNPGDSLNSSINSILPTISDDSPSIKSFSSANPHDLLIASRTQSAKNRRRRKKMIEKRKSLASAAAACFATTPRDAGSLTDDDFDYSSDTYSDYEFDTRSVGSSNKRDAPSKQQQQQKQGYPPFFLRMEDVTRVEWSSLKSTQPAATTNRRKSKVSSSKNNDENLSSSSSSRSIIRHPQMLIVTISTSIHHTELNFYNQQSKALLIAFLRSTLPRKVFRVKSIVGSSVPVVQMETEDDEIEQLSQRDLLRQQYSRSRSRSSNKSMLNLLGTDSGSYVDMENFEGKAVRERFQNESFLDRMKRRCARLAIRVQEACFCYDLDCVQEDFAKELDQASTVNTSVMTEIELDIFDECNESTSEERGAESNSNGSILLQLVGGTAETDNNANDYQKIRHLELEKVLSSLSKDKGKGDNNNENKLEDVMLDNEHSYDDIGRMLELTFSEDEANLFGNNNCCMDTEMDIQKSFLMQ